MTHASICLATTDIRSKYNLFTVQFCEYSVKLCTSQISSTHVQLHGVRFEHELVFSAVRFNLRQETQTVRGSSLASLLFSVSVIHGSKEKGEKSVPFHLTFDFFDVKLRYVTDGVMSAAKGINITLARSVWARHSALWGEEEIGWHWWEPRITQGSRVWQTVGSHHKHAISLAGVTRIIGIYASHRPLKAQHNSSDRLFHCLIFGCIRGRHFWTSWTISISSNSIRLNGEKTRWEDNIKSDITETTWLCGPTHEVQGNVIRTFCEQYSALYWFSAPPYLTINIEPNSMKVHNMWQGWRRAVGASL